jgi:Chaperone of endosialidase
MNGSNDVEFVVNGSINSNRGIKVNSQTALKRTSAYIGVGDVVDVKGGSGNILIGDNSGTNYDESVNRIALGNDVINTKDNSIFTYRNLTPNLGVPSLLTYDSRTGQIGPQISSKIYKRNIRTLPKRLSSKIYSLKPRTFMFDGEKRKSIGLIAEDVEKSIPQIVTRDDKGDVSGIRYDLLSVLLLNEVKNLKREIQWMRQQRRKRRI